MKNLLNTLKQSTSFYTLTLVAALLLVFASGCKEEITVSDQVNTHTPILYIGSFAGQVFDENMEPIESAEITIGSKTVVSDVNGYYLFSSIELDKNGTQVLIESDGFWDLHKIVNLQESQVNLLKVMLLPQSETRKVNSETGGVVSFDEVTIDFPENAFKTLDGSRYSGEVTVSAVYLDPQDQNIGMMSPGDFRAISSDNSIQTLLTYGMAGVEINGSNGEELKLDDTVTATLSLPLPDGASIDEVPLWHFDEQTSYWIEEGLAVRDGDQLISEVSHFSWWNYDVPFDPIHLSGAVFNEMYTPMPGLLLQVFLAETSQFVNSAYTGNIGEFNLVVPKDEELLIKILDDCGDEITNRIVGPFSEDESLEILTILNPTYDYIDLCGTLSDCESNQLGNGYIVVKYDENMITVPVDDDGSFCISVNVCDSESLVIQGVDYSSGLIGLPTSYQTSDSPFEDLDVKACDEVSTYCRYQINGGDFVYLEGFKIVLVGGDNVFGVVFESASTGVPIEGYLLFAIENSMVYILDLNFPEYSCQTESGLAVEYEEFSSNGIGEPFLASFGGTCEADQFWIELSGILSYE